MAPWNDKLTNLRNLLAGLYLTTSDARRIVVDAGMNPIYIRFSEMAINTWQSILEEAEHRDKVDAIIAAARKDYPEDQQLALAAEDQLHLAIQAPELNDKAWQGPRDAAQLERIIGGVSSLRPISFLQHGLEVSRAVARVVLTDGTRGTGFLIKGDLLITNNHVIPSKAAAQGAQAEFNYQQDAEKDPYGLDPDAVFETSPQEEEGGDDWTVVKLKGDPGAKWGTLALIPGSPKVRDEVIIIQHPGGGYKQIALSHNTVAFVNDKRLQYLTDTLEGSSGSPVFNSEWQVVALHHKGGWLREPGTKLTVFRNQGVHVNVLIQGLKDKGLL